MRSFAVTISGCLVMLAAPGVARAQESAAAQRLFAEGRVLLDKGDVEPACARFEESRALDQSAVGTLLNLAICNERRGRLASAWLQLSEVISVSRATRPDRVALADERIRAVEPRLSKLAVKVPPEAQVPGLVVSVDGKPRPPSSFGTFIAIDGGEHVITASAQGYATYTTKVNAPVEKGSLEISIPKLERVAIEPVQPPPQQTAPVTPPVLGVPAPAEPSSVATTGWIVAAGGIVALAVGTGFGIAVLSGADNVRDESRSTEARNEDYKRLLAQSWISNVSLPVGAVLTGVGAFLVLTSKPSRGPNVGVGMTVTKSQPMLRAGAHDVRIGWETSF